jgi:DNA repair exonuclease SbcCD nuclease subunit
MADVHLGAHREPVMQRLEMNCFNQAMDRCLELDVDFILISGDLFHVGIPDLSVVNEAIQKMRTVQLRGVPIYVIYGSHDYTPTGTSIIDLLHTAGLVTKIVKWRMEEGRLKLDLIKDPKTGAKLTGISARKIGLESRYYEVLDREGLEREEGFKIFAFHSGLTEFKPEYLSQMETVSISYFPKHFDYYAGGHIHDRGEFTLPGYGRIVFPGPLFTGYGRDLEVTSRGEKRGFYLVNFDEKVRDIQFQEVDSFEGAYMEYDVTGMNSQVARKKLREELDKLDVKGKVTVIKIRGELAGGRTSDLDFPQIRSDLTGRGAIHIYINRYALRSKEHSAVKVVAEEVSTIENRLLKENLSTVKVRRSHLRDEGETMARELLRSLRQGSKVNESKKDYQARMIRSAVETLNLKEMID